MRKNKLSILLATVTLFGLVGCGKQTHTHEFDYDNLTWNWTKLTEGGYSATASAKCKGCEESIVQNATVTSSVVTPSTCIEKGLISYTGKTTFGGVEYSDSKSDFLPLGEHTYGATSYAWSPDSTECTASRECSVCHDVQEEEGVVENEIVVEPTCEHGGISNLKATFDVDWAQTQYGTEVPIPQKEHEFGTNLICSSCKKTLKEIKGLNDATADDLILPVTLGALGQSAFDFSANHTFVNFDFDKNGNFELNYSYKYTQHTTGGDSYYAIYLFNGRDEKGLVLHVNTNRESGGSDVYIYRNSATQAGAAFKGAAKIKDLPTSRSEDGHYYFPFKSKLAANTSTDSNIMSIKGTVVNKSTNEYNVVVKTGGSYADLSQLTTDYNYGEPANDITLNITLGSSYFDSLSNPCFRFSKAQATAVHASDYNKSYSDREVVYQDLDGKVHAKKTYTGEEEIIAPEIKKEGYKFIGWCDQAGNDTRDITANGKYILTPRFIADLGEKQARQTLSDFVMGDKDTTKWTNSWNGENISTYGMLDADASTELVEVAFRYRFEFASSDLYPVFGFTYDGVNENGRVNTRLDLINTRASLRGYIYGGKTSLGNAGADGTRFEDGSYSMVQGMIYMLRIQIVKNASDFSINLIVESLGNGLSTTVTKNFTYNSSERTDFSNPLFTKFCINAATYAPMVKDAY